MTNSKLWPVKLKARCEAVGWDVTMSRSGHYKVRTKRGRGFTFPSTPSDRRAELNSLATARRHGLDELERRLEALNERGRLERIAADRSTVGSALVAAAIQSGKNIDSFGESKEEGPEVKKEVAATVGALGYALVPPKNGAPGDESVSVAIAEVAPAMHTTPLTRGKAVPLRDAEEVLLVDGRVFYRCLKPAATVMNPSAKGVCHRVFDTPHGVKGHITFHSRTTMPTAPGQRRKAEVDPEYAERLQMAKQAAEDVALERQIASETTGESSLKLPGVMARMVALIESFERSANAAAELSANLTEQLDAIRRLAAELPEHLASDEVMHKASKYDELRQVMG